MKTKILLLCFVLFCTASFASSQDKSVMTRSNVTPIKVGEIAPDFKLTDQKGNLVQLSKANSPAVLVFYRGYW